MVVSRTLDSLPFVHSLAFFFLSPQQPPLAVLAIPSPRASKLLSSSIGLSALFFFRFCFFFFFSTLAYFLPIRRLPERACRCCCCIVTAFRAV